MTRLELIRLKKRLHISSTSISSYLLDTFEKKKYLCPIKTSHKIVYEPIGKNPLVKFSINFIDGSKLVYILSRSQRDHLFKNKKFGILIKDITGLGYVQLLNY